MTDYNAITPPPELMQQWIKRYEDGAGIQPLLYSIFQAGADQELEACCEWLVRNYNYPEAGNPLLAARRPNPPSLKEQALETLKYPKDLWSQAEVDTIRRALEALDD
jgi:hypothetical protein